MKPLNLPITGLHQNCSPCQVLPAPGLTAAFPGRKGVRGRGYLLSSQKIRIKSPGRTRQKRTNSCQGYKHMHAHHSHGSQF